MMFLAFRRNVLKLPFEGVLLNFPLACTLKCQPSVPSHKFCKKILMLVRSYVEQTIGAFSDWSRSIQMDGHRADYIRAKRLRCGRSNLGGYARSRASGSGN